MNRRRQAAKTRRGTSPKLGIESLERRTLMTADPGWAFGLGGPLLISDVADTEVAIGPDNHLYVAGAFRSTVDFDPGPGTANFTTNVNAQDGFIAKYTPQGALVWVQRFGQAISPIGVGNEFSTGIQFDALGSVYVSGWTNASAPQFGSTTLAGQGSYDAFVTKLDAASGAFLWTRGLGGVGDDRANGLAVTAAGDVYVTGSFSATVDFNPSPTGAFAMTPGGGTGDSDAYVWKLDGAGNFVWARQFSGLTNEFGHRVVVGADGEIYAAGTFRNATDFGEPGNPLTLTSATPDVASIYFAKLDDVSGNSIWATQLTGDGPVVAARLVADSGGSLYLAGHFSGTMSPNGGATTLTSAGGEDGFVSKWDAAGNVQWIQSIATGAGDLMPGQLALDPNGGLLIGYGFDGAADFDPGPSVASLISSDEIDGAVVKLNADGSFAWARQLAGPGATWASGIVVDALGNAYAAGFYENSVKLPTGHALTNPGTGAGTFEPGNSQFLLKLAFGDPATKFYVVDDASTNRTFEYQSSGAAGDNSGLNSGNSAPRGAASTAAGDRVWVVDANRKVFVYDNNGNVLGSWTAGSLSSTATPEGIATNGTDVWIVDSKSDKVYRYTGAATRLSGSQNAANSFSLNSGNKDAADIVTDGASLWVVNNASTDKVFKYNLAGALLGSWTIDAANKNPTGITIDPANVSHLWIVDSGADRVYQYNAAATRTSGSQSAASWFALAPGNTNPQGIADPPSPGAAVSGTENADPTTDSAIPSGIWSLALTADASASQHSPVTRGLRARRGQEGPAPEHDAALADFPSVRDFAPSRRGGFVAVSRGADSSPGACQVEFPAALDAALAQLL